MATVWPWTERLRELVSKGPVSVSQAMAEMKVLVPPGRAYRDGERQKDWHVSEADAKFPDRRRIRSEIRNAEAVKDERIRRGAHRLAYQSIWQQKRAGHVELYDKDGERMVRLGPKPWKSDGE